tara:strand:+ start:1401 stop:2063 length:663 start_codon:yes stop_codon:yes gene_type:complete
MCSINHNKKAIFIHIPKTGGSFITETLSTYYGFKNYYLKRPDHNQFCKIFDNSVDKHENKLFGTLLYYKTSNYLNKIMNMNKNKWETYFIFTFVRNPYDRLVSGFSYCSKKYDIKFENYLFNAKNMNCWIYWHCFMPQIRHIVNEYGENKVDFVGKYENLSADFCRVLNLLKFNIIHINKVKNRSIHKHYTNYYNNDNIKITNKIIEDDLKNLNYNYLEL